jgi:hypothetical protein
MRYSWLRALPLLLALFPRTILAQDSFELEVYGHDTAKPGEWELESHFVFSGRGSTQVDGTVAPTNHQIHLALEATRGLTPNWEIAAYGLFARQSGESPEYAGWRLRSRVSSPDEWQLPVDLALNVEMSYTRPIFDDHTYALEITPIVGRQWGPVRVDLNAAMESPLAGSDKGKWELEPSFRTAVAVSGSVDLTLEYFSALGPINALDPMGRQVHQLYPGMVLHFGDDFSWSAGLGVGLTGSGDRMVAKTAIEWEL